MNFVKTIILVIILAIIIGALIVFVPKFLTQTKTTNTSKTNTVVSQTGTPQKTPVQTLPPVLIDQNSDLKSEINKIEIPDFKSEFDTLKSELK